MTQLPLDEELAKEFRIAITRVILFNDQISQKLGMNSSEMQTLHLLQLHGSLTPSDVARHTSLKSSSITAILDRLEGLKFIQRSPHPTDRRKVVVAANESRISTVVAPYYTEKATQLKEVTARFTATEIEIITRFIKLLNAE